MNFWSVGDTTMLPVHTGVFKKILTVLSTWSFLQVTLEKQGAVWHLLLPSKETSKSVFLFRFTKLCSPYQTTNDIFHRTGTKNFTVCIETQKTPNSQSNFDKEKLTWRNQASWLQTILQSCSHQDSVVLAQNGTNWKAQRLDLHTYGHLTFDRRGKNMQWRWRRDSLVNKWP